MSYYPTERQGGCMESITRCCRQVYVYPVDTRKLLYGGGGLLGIIIVAVVWSGLSSPSDSSTDSFKGQTVLTEVPLVVGSNFFLKNLKELAHNSVYNVSFDQNLQNDSVFGDAVCSNCQTDLSRLKEGLVGSQLWSIYVSCDAEYKDSVSLTLEQIDTITRLINRYSDSLDLVTSSSELTVNFNNNKLSSLLALTSGLSIDGRLAVLRVLYSLGVRVMALASNCSSDWAGSYMDTNQSVGLSSLGQSIVKEMNRLGIVIDLSEASHQTQLDVLNITTAPVIFTRAAAYSVYNHSRNIQDDVIDLLIENGGMLMVTFAEQYLSGNTSNNTILSVIDHLNYLKSTAGVTAVGIGAEFDQENQTFPSTLKDVSMFPTLFDALGDTGTWKEADLKKLAGQNFVRVLKAVEKVATDSASTQADETYKLYVDNSSATCYSDFSSRDGNSQNVTAVTVATATTTLATVITTLATANTTIATANATTVSANTTTVSSNTTQSSV